MNGDSLWVRKYNGPGNSYDNAYDIAIDNLLNVYITGESFGSGTDYDVATIKYSSSGNQEWLVRWSGPGSGWDAGVKIQLDNINNVYIAGGTPQQVGSSSDFLTIKYSQTSAIKTINNEVPEKYYLFQNYPNPFNNSTFINYQLPIDCNVTLRIFNILGQEIETLVNQPQKAGIYQIKYDVFSLSSGAYFYTIETENYRDTKIMILNK